MAYTILQREEYLVALCHPSSIDSCDCSFHVSMTQLYGTCFIQVALIFLF